MVSGKPSITPLKADEAEAEAAADDVADNFRGVVRNFLATSAALIFVGGEAAEVPAPTESKTKLQSQSSVLRSSKKERCI